LKGRNYITAIYIDGQKSFFETPAPTAWGTLNKPANIGVITPVFGGGRGTAQLPYDDWYLVGEIKNARIYD
jgi:hypothetical protein